MYVYTFIHIKYVAQPVGAKLPKERQDTSRTEDTQRSQYPLIKEYTLNHNVEASLCKVYSLIKGYWVLWVLRVCRGRTSEWQHCKAQSLLIALLHMPNTNIVPLTVGSLLFCTLNSRILPILYPFCRILII